MDSGRVLRVDLEQPAPPQVLLSPGDSVQEVLVLEPLDLAVAGDVLFVLDRAGDVYAYDALAGTWRIDRYDRPVEASSGHYFVALDVERVPGTEEPLRALLETNYKFVQLYGGEADRLWRLAEQRAIDLSFYDGSVYVLQRELHDQAAALYKYRDTSLVPSFAPHMPLAQPRQIVATAQGLFVLDEDGRRLLQFDLQSGALLRLYQLPDDRRPSVIAWNESTGRLLLAGKDRLYFLGDAERLTSIPGQQSSRKRLSSDPALLAALDDFVVPIGGSNITFRDFQLPGAPRHYRLGVHNGLDFYWQPGTKVLAAGAGTVIRADNEYSAPSANDLARWSSATYENGFTPADVLDNYLGRQVWIEHEPGIVTRYAHLRSIESGIAPGTTVSRGQPIGEVGNSGSPASLEGEAVDAHLHFELWVDDTYLGEYLRPIETRDWIERVFPTSRDGS